MKNHLPENLKKLREMLGMTQQQFSVKLGKSRAMCNQYELGNFSPSIEILIKLKKLYNINIDSFITKKCEWVRKG